MYREVFSIRMYSERVRKPPTTSAEDSITVPGYYRMYAKRTYSRWTVKDSYRCPWLEGSDRAYSFPKLVSFDGNPLMAILLLARIPKRTSWAL